MNTYSLKIYVIIGVVVFVLIITLIIGDRMMKSELDKDIEKLFADSKNISDKVYTSKQIKDMRLVAKQHPPQESCTPPSRTAPSIQQNFR
uniref:Uncharacterized protein n=1 Tax=Candidatus Methanogaster sp. ANME-2c ERB4 TaxID=2759911 RepID=A0A7G9YFA1_9EURY|nr:hypothetical protein GCLKPONB_00016 [Methanosarcinales archaeon ANME-2c ERB4]